jgi:hypothetical protein
MKLIIIYSFIIFSINMLKAQIYPRNLTYKEKTYHGKAHFKLDLITFSFPSDSELEVLVEFILKPKPTNINSETQPPIRIHKHSSAKHLRKFLKEK